MWFCTCNIYSSLISLNPFSSFKKQIRHCTLEVPCWGKTQTWFTFRTGISKAFSQCLFFLAFLQQSISFPIEFLNNALLSLICLLFYVPNPYSLVGTRNKFKSNERDVVPGTWRASEVIGKRSIRQIITLVLNSSWGIQAHLAGYFENS